MDFMLRNNLIVSKVLSDEKDRVERGEEQGAQILHSVFKCVILHTPDKKNN